MLGCEATIISQGDALTRSGSKAHGFFMSENMTNIIYLFIFLMDLGCMCVMLLYVFPPMHD